LYAGLEDDQYEPYCQGGLRDDANVRSQRLFRTFLDVAENPCYRPRLSAAVEDARPKFYLKYVVVGGVVGGGGRRGLGGGGWGGLTC
jgi:hypothetical protein